MEKLRALWNEFASNPDARVLRWLVRTDEWDIVRVFLEVERSETGECPELFLVFDRPFASMTRYGIDLAQDMRKQFADSQEELSAQGLDQPWRPPAVTGVADSRVLVAHCESLCGHYEDIDYLALVLLPSQVAGYSQWDGWLQKLVGGEIPENVRVLVCDDVTSPQLDALAAKEPKRVVTQKLDLNMPSLIAELVKEHRGAGGPGADFREQFVALTTAAGKGDIAAARKAADASIATARANKWPLQEVTALMAFANACLAAGDAKQAVKCYRDARKVTATLQGDEAAVGAKVDVQTRLAEGAAMVSAGAFVEASAVYEATAPIAEKQGDPLMTIESWRMAAYCHEQARNPESAWKCGQAALKVGEKLEPDARKSTTLGYAAAGLMRVAKKKPYKDQAPVLERKIGKLLGPGWENGIEKGASKS
ncbi:MAG TPA: hypothetical protein VEC56_05835 [Candidatus Krumholzibacteria bacterium]|nr:hypothetical protein [Candidatus Krumholzibacteria bacterium]